jgi:type I restriction enzyme S subunit
MPTVCPLSPLGAVPEGWKVVRLKEITKKIGSGATPTGGESVYLSSRHRFALIRSQNVYDRRFDDTGLAYILDSDAAKLRGVAVETNDILLNITGDGVTFARACLVPERVRPACVNQHVSIVRADASLCSPGFLLSYLTHPNVKEYVESFNAGGSRRAITKGHIESFCVPLPPLDVQRAIAGLLGILDDKIDLNRRTNETLESMARAIFKSWFVDFDPVRAKADGRQPTGMDAETASLFPSGFTDSPNGVLPSGWHIVQLGQELEHLEVGLRPKGGAVAAGVPSIGAESIVGLGHFDYSQTKYVPLDFFVTMGRGQIQSGDVLVYKDGGRPGEYEPHVTMFGDGFPFERCCINEHVYRVRTKPRVGQPYLYFWLTTDFTTDQMRIRGTGVAIPGLNSVAFRSIPLLLPHATLCRAFGDCVSPMLRKVFLNCNQSRTLATLRDALLPKLLSGELRLPDAEKVVEAHL